MFVISGGNSSIGCVSGILGSASPLGYRLSMVYVSVCECVCECMRVCECVFVCKITRVCLAQKIPLACWISIFHIG